MLKNSLADKSFGSDYRLYDFVLVNIMPLIDTNTKRIVLASQSPRRIELLKKIISDFEIKISDISEKIDENDPILFVKKISNRKATKVAQQIDNGIIIGADSIVVNDDKILGKPQNEQEAIWMLNFLSGHVHQVFTGLTIIEKPGNKIISDFEVTNVKFRTLAAWEIEKYVRLERPYDKAGSYGIQDGSAVFVERVEGCFYNVMGLPVTKLFKLLIPFLSP